MTQRIQGAFTAALGAATRAVVAPYRPGDRPSRTVAIVVPLSTRRTLLPDEEVSMRHLCHFLGRHDKFLIAPEGLSIEREGFKTLHFGRRFFGSAAAHNQLLMWPAFYETFRDYEYILMYHLDSLVFSDDLIRWCRAGWDYIGAPWIPCPETPWVKEPRVGNGGFALMKIESVLQVLRSRYRKKPVAFWADLLTRNGTRLRPLFTLAEAAGRVFPGSALLSRLLRGWRASRNPAPHGLNNDYFWSYQAVAYMPTFRVAPVEEGLRFAFEAAPRLCFDLTHGQLPFGCHAWEKFDRGFWEPHLLPAA
jgi:hypothetical protein